MHEREEQFVSSFFTHDQWLYEPAMFRLASGKYTPDFYDARRNVWIEVVGTRQAFHQAKHKYSEFRKQFPMLTFELRNPQGKMLSLKKLSRTRNNREGLTICDECGNRFFLQKNPIESTSLKGNYCFSCLVDMKDLVRIKKTGQLHQMT